MRAAVGTALAVAIVPMLSGEAHACSCAGATAEQVYASSRAAFIGTLDRVARRGVDSGRFHYDVRESFKRDLGDKVVIRSSLQESACGLPKREGKKIAMGIDGHPGRWSSGLCSITSARGLRQAAEGDAKAAGASPRPRCGKTGQFGAGVDSVASALLRVFA